MTKSLLAAKTIPLHLLLLKNIPIYEQLQLEEALLRADDRNWCLMNTNSSPAIVMGISGKPEQLIDPCIMAQKPVPVIKRFSGGGTVFIDANTVFVSWICNKIDADTTCCPVKIHQWSAAFYQQAFPELNILLRENDYVIGERKIGGNAQYLCKDRWLHHSSLLWDYHPDNMRYLLMPKKVPNYRQQRSHDDFLSKLSLYLPSKQELQTRLQQFLKDSFHVVETSWSDVADILRRPHRKATSLIERMKQKDEI